MTSLNLAMMRAGDVGYYGGGGAAALLMGSVPAMRAARLPVLALLAANLGAEQWLMARLLPYMDLDSNGIVHAVLPMPRTLSTMLQSIQSRMRRLLLGLPSKQTEVCLYTITLI